MTSNFSYDECFKAVESGADVYMQWNELGAISLQMFNLFNLLWNQMSNLKKKISDVSDKYEYIESIKGVGYKFKSN